MGETLVVYVVLYADDINTIDDKEMDFRLDFYLRHEWNVSQHFCRPYLKKLNEGNIFLNTTEKTAIILKNDFKYFWVPDNISQNSRHKKQIEYKWDVDSTMKDKSALYLNPDLRLLQHSVYVTTGSSDSTSLRVKYSVALATFTFKRQLLNKLSSVYFPSLLVVGLSWLSFWSHDSIGLNPRSCNSVRNVFTFNQRTVR
ncbi:unnamed protein product [Medioppia subpectinata]|uniref:Uncharacterized protein n=1 Tax=Medioppia subpectinata TaxID=1979941 RepID=A0A7R9LJG4_9ACAR|nr:unnamed protein product [Medioppia subpectinata]CAG2119364.1 unnamed protein product [Medioppia subpectinata]